MMRNKIGFVFMITAAAVLQLQCIQQKETAMPTKPIDQVLREYTDELMRIPGVVGTAQGSCEEKPCIKVLVVRKTAELQKRIPVSLDGWKVTVEEVGNVRAL